MTELLDHAVKALRKLPPDMQDELARMVLEAVGQDQPAVVLDADEAASFAESLGQEERGEFADDAEVRTIWAKHNL